MRLCERFKVAPILEPEDHAAGVDGDSINMAECLHLMLVIVFGELTGNAVLKIYEGATEGAKTSALTFSYRATSADLKNASGDTLGSETTSAELTLTAATYEDRMIVVEIDPRELADGYDWVTPEVSSDASEEFAAIIAIAVPRYAEDVPPTIIK